MYLLQYNNPGKPVTDATLKRWVRSFKATHGCSSFVTVEPLGNGFMIQSETKKSLENLPERFGKCQRGEISPVRYYRTARSAKNSRS